MSAPTLTREEAAFILTALSFTKQAFEEHEYPTYAIKLDRIAECERVVEKVRAIRNSIPNTSKERA